MGMKPISLYGLGYLGNLVSIAQPAASAYRSSTLYGASEQAVGGATAIAALSVASIIGPQVSSYVSDRSIRLRLDRFIQFQTSHGTYQASVLHVLHSHVL